MELPTINTKKTKIMRMSTVEGRTMKITVNGQNLERVKQSCYLGSLVTEKPSDEAWASRGSRRPSTTNRKRDYQAQQDAT